jgi:RNA polymerase sigma-70 factor, ECF subfamily
MKRRTNDEWVSALTAAGDEQTIALNELRAYVLRAAFFTLHRSRQQLDHASSPALEQLAEDCAQEAVISILQHLKHFRGDSQFTTWAYTFAVNVALVAARRERWKRVPLDSVIENPRPSSPWAGDEGLAADPERHALQAEALAAIREGIDGHLTVKQQQVVSALVFEQVPLDEVARHWGTNRNALYKLLHDARRRLKAHLEARGFDLKDLLRLFAAER